MLAPATGTKQKVNARTQLRTFPYPTQSKLFNLCSAVAEMGDHLAIIDMDRKLRGALPLWGGELGPHQTQCDQGRGLPPYQEAGIFIQLFGHNIHGKKLGAIPFGGGGAGSPSNTMWPRLRPTCKPSFVLIHPTVWPQYDNVTDRQTDRQDKQCSDSIGCTVLQTVTQWEARPLVGGQCFDTVECWLSDNKGIRNVKTCATYPLKQLLEENEEKPANHVYQETGCWNGGGCYHIQG